MRSDFIAAVTQLCNEKGISQSVVLSAIETALISAYKRNFGTTQNVTARIDPETGEAHIYAQKKVTPDVADPRAEIGVAEALAINPAAQVDELVDIEMTPKDFGRIAAQTAKQVVTQKLREAERDVIFTEFTEREQDIITATVQRLDPKGVIMELRKEVEAILPPSEQIQSENYHIGQRLKVFVLEVHRTPKGPQVTLSRTHRNLVRRLFELEVPEIFNGTVEIKSIAREPGSRTKVAVSSRQDGVDPVGSCVGQRGVRIQNILNELNGEKIDVVQWSQDPVVFAANALSPAQVQKVEIDDDEHTATVIVDDKQLSLAIGKEGQNARLAAKLTGWRIDIKSASAAAHEPALKRRKPVMSTGGEEESLLAMRLQEALQSSQPETDAGAPAEITPSAAPEPAEQSAQPANSGAA